MLRCALLTLLLIGLSPALADQAYVELTDATLILDDAGQPPVKTGKPVTLPFFPRGEQVIPRGSVAWFRIEFPRPAEVSEPAVYIWRHNVSADIFLNGERIGGNNIAHDRTPIGWNRPLLATMPQAALRDQNVLAVRLSTGEFGGMLSSVLLGERTALQALYDDRFFWQIETSELALILAVAMGIFSLMLWLRRRNDTQYLIYAAACLTYTLTPLYMTLDFIPLTLPLWLGLVHTGGTWSSYFLVRFILKATDKHWPSFIRGLFGVSLLATVLHFIYPEGYFFYLAYGFHFVSLLALLLVGSVVMIDSVRTRESTSLWISAGYVGMGMLLAHDLFFFLFGNTDEVVHASNLMQLGTPLLLFVLFAHLVNRFVNALDESETLNRTLEARVEANRLALEHSYAENRRMEILESAAREREKIYRDLHDDVGSKLVNIVHAGESEQDVSLARAALESLREAIYRANYQNQPVRQLIDDLRTEIELRTDNAGLILDWRDDVPVPDEVLDSEFCFHLSRICRELVTNILHHSKATCVTMCIKQHDGALLCEVRDDGVGFNGASVCAGNGVKNIRHRVGTLGGEIEWSKHEPGGTLVQFRLPITTGATA